MYHQSTIYNLQLIYNLHSIYNQTIKNEKMTTKGGSGGLTLCFVIFDCLWCDNPHFVSTEMEKQLPPHRGNLTQLKLQTRKKYLQWLVHPLPHRFYVSPATTVKGSTAEQERTQILKDWMEKVLKQHHEGVVVKCVNSPYMCGSGSKKKGFWMKLKPEYFQELTDTLDVVILAGYYGDGKSRTTMKRAGKISGFLIG